MLFVFFLCILGTPNTKYKKSVCLIVLLHVLCFSLCILFDAIFSFSILLRLYIVSGDTLKEYLNVFLSPFYYCSLCFIKSKCISFLYCLTDKVIIFKGFLAFSFPFQLCVRAATCVYNDLCDTTHMST